MPIILGPCCMLRMHPYWLLSGALTLHLFFLREEPDLPHVCLLRRPLWSWLFSSRPWLSEYRGARMLLLAFLGSMLNAGTCSSYRLRTSTLPNGRLYLWGFQAVGLLTSSWQRSHPFPLAVPTRNLVSGSLHLAPGAAQVKKVLPSVFSLLQAAFFHVMTAGMLLSPPRAWLPMPPALMGTWPPPPLHFYIDGPQCPACAAFHHTRPRCLHHVRIFARCRAAVLFVAPRILPDRVLELDLIDRKAMQQLKRSGLPRLFAALPAYCSTLPGGA